MNIRKTLEYDVPVYQTTHWRYVRISDFREEDRRELADWVFGRFQPLIQGEKGAILDAVFFEDYLEYLGA